MEETFEELVTKHTRRELEEMALSCGAENLGGTKSQLAEAILEAIKKQKESPKPAKQEKPQVVQMVEKPKISTGSTMQPAKNGVMAKISAINSKSGEFQTAGRQMREEGIRKMNKGIKEFHSATDTMSKNMTASLRNIASDAKKMQEDGLQRFNAGQVAFKNDLNLQIKENSEAISRFNSGAGEIKSATDKMAKEFQKAGKDMREDGFRNLQNGLSQFRSDVNSQVKSNRDAISKIDAAARDLQGRAKAFHDEIHRYQEQDLKNYTRDFYYG
ncbi:MAG: hypothetical protein ACE14P_10230 [Methanotrichaceae archaeon]